MKCLEDNKKQGTACTQVECRNWIDYEKDTNCVLEAVRKNGTMTLREVSERMGISFVRVKQIEEKALKKLGKMIKQSTI